MTVSIVRLGVATGLILSATVGVIDGASVPRYALEPGQVLTYEAKETFKGQNLGSTTRTTWRLWVVGRNDDGSWRIVARTAAKTTFGETATPSGQDREEVALARFDLHPSGEVPYCATLGIDIDPSDVFPRLPRDEKELKSWEAHDDRDDATTRYKPIEATTADAADSSGSSFAFEADRRSHVERIYEGKTHRVFHFDQKKQLISRAESAKSYGWPANASEDGRGTLELTSVAEMEPARLATFRDEMDRYFGAHQAYLALFRQARISPDAGSLFSQARKVLADARARVTLAEPIAACEDRLQSHDQALKSELDRAKSFAAMVGRPAPDWKINDLDGETHSLEGYRGKVLVLDFWYRGCGWCMRALPQVKRVASHYRGRPVVVLAINNDRKIDDAKFVVKEMHLEYPVLHSEELPVKYGIRAFPTVIVIDQQGNVAGIHSGYARQFEDVTEIVDRLLRTE